MNSTTRQALTDLLLGRLYPWWLHWSSTTRNSWPMSHTELTYRLLFYTIFPDETLAFHLLQYHRRRNPHG